MQTCEQSCNKVTNVHSKSIFNVPGMLSTNHVVPSSFHSCDHFVAAACAVYPICERAISQCRSSITHECHLSCDPRQLSTAKITLCPLSKHSPCCRCCRGSSRGLLCARCDRNSLDRRNWRFSSGIRLWTQRAR